MTYIIPAVHPAYVLHQGKPITDIIRADLAKAKRIAIEGTHRQREQHVIVLPSNPCGLETTIRAAVGWMQHWRSVQCPVAVDVETSSLRYWVAKLYSMAVSGLDGNNASVALTLGDLITLPYEAYLAVTGPLRELLADPNVPKILHNSPYDRAICARKGIEINGQLIDTLGLAHLIQPDTDHTLGGVGHTYLDVEPWKLDHEGKAKAFTSDLVELLVYNSKDANNDAQLVPHLMQDIADRGMSQELVQYQMAYGDMCLEMELAGLPINRDKRRQMGAKVLDDVKRLEHEMEEILGWPGFKPDSPTQRIEALFGKKYRGLQPTALTEKTRQPSTQREDLLDYLEDPFVMRFVKRAELARAYATWYKEKGYNGATEDGSFSSAVYDDGRMHCQWNAYGQTAPRFTAKPLVQAVSLEHRAWFEAPPGCVFVAADKDQLELRISACLAGATILLEEMAKPDGDPHTLACILVFGEAFTKETPKQRKYIRDGMKNTTYSGLYEGALPTVHRTVRKNKFISAELRAMLTLDFVAKAHKGYFGKFPEIFECNQRDYLIAGKLGYTQIEPLGRRRYWPVWPAPYNEVVNWRVQARGAEFCSRAMVHMREAYRHYGIKDAYIVLHGHDQAVTLCREADAEHVKRITDDIFGADVLEGPKGPVKLTAKAKIGKTLKDVK